MSIREKIIDYSRGNDLSRFWRLYRRQQRAKSGFRRDVLTFLMSRCAARHGGYIGPDAVIRGVPSLPHGLHGVFISRYAVIGANCRIYQNVTIGEIAGKAPEIGDGCLIGAGAVVACNVPDHALMLGVPAQQRGWVCECGQVLHQTGISDYRCPDCGRTYQLKEEQFEEMK